LSLALEGFSFYFFSSFFSSFFGFFYLGLLRLAGLGFSLATGSLGSEWESTDSAS
jgi:hypothetical protein